jgi:hypothetical protein
MEYTVNKVDGQELMFAIATTHNDETITFNVVCASDKSEIPELVLHHLDFLDNPPTVQPANQDASQDLKSIVQELSAQVTTLQAQVTALKG